MGQLVTKVLVSRESPLPPCQLGLDIIAPSRGVESPVPTGVHTLAWTAVDECCENPRKKIWLRLVWTNPIPVNLLKGLKEGVFQV